jgi:hypothetical protein
MTGHGVMAVWNDLEPGHESEFERWYRLQHIPERLAVEGFREARRYVAPNGTPRYAAFYWLDSVAVLDSPAYRQRLANPTAWTRRMMPRFRNMGRTPCSVVVDRGAGMGGAASWIAGLRAGVGANVAPRAALSAAFERCLIDPACVRIQLWECDLAIAGLGSPEARYRASADAVCDWIVFVEGASAQALIPHLEALANVARAHTPALMCAPVCRLLWRMAAAEAPPPCPDPRWDEDPGA